ncbi:MULTISPECIES: hypothetical protein [unclassified Arenibacter]|jgi:hypothetical protein|uniref:hypothetical protein n=1 Tax=unclassified Arenibacter TaxID=2615047 RepID=UPI000E3501F1|nr:MULTISPECIES: hypothetical protein [unclassified Arenibacter]MCM4162231.1 hypothetical protein [Arenibacter sp. A80]RFT57838.1 hypothetical protein D0S24_01350 [Arenibacter sp. P308M17]
MITENKNQDKNSGSKGLNNEVQQNRGLNLQRSPSEDSDEGIGKPVDNGGVVTSEYDVHLEKQWLAVRDDYLANFPELNDLDTRYDKNSFGTLIANLAKRRQQTSAQVQEEIMNWPSSE